MSDVLRRWRTSARQMRHDWPPERHEAIKQAVGRRLRAVPRRRVAAIAAVSGVGLVVALGLWPAENAARITRLSPATMIEAVAGSSVAPERETLRLRAGGVRLSVGAGRRPVRILAGPYVIEDIGTVFSVTLGERGQVAVVVEEGRVSVKGAGQDAVLVGGQRVLLPAEARPVVRALPETSVGGMEVPDPEGADPDVANDSRGDPSVVFGPRRDRDAALVRAVDRARVARDLDKALRLLDRAMLTKDHDDNGGRGPWLRFVRGKVLFDSGRFAAAAAAFDDERDGPFGEEALVRAAEAWHRTGETALSVARARAYLQKFPGHPHEAAMNRLLWPRKDGHAPSRD